MGGFARGKDETALPRKCAALLQVGAADGGALPAGPRRVTAAIINFFPSVFTFIAPWDLYLKTTTNDSVPEGTEQRDNTPKSHGC